MDGVQNIAKTLRQRVLDAGAFGRADRRVEVSLDEWYAAYDYAEDHAFFEHKVDDPAHPLCPPKPERDPSKTTMLWLGHVLVVC